MSGTEFDRKAKVVASAWGMMEGDPKWSVVLDRFNLGFPFAWMVVSDLGTLNDEGMQYVLDTYNFLVRAVPDKEYNNYLEVLREVSE